MDCDFRSDIRKCRTAIGKDTKTDSGANRSKSIGASKPKNTKSPRGDRNSPFSCACGITDGVGE